jgi:hypothetical protein
MLLTLLRLPTLLSMARTTTRSPRAVAQSLQLPNLLRSLESLHLQSLAPNLAISQSLATMTTNHLLPKPPRHPRHPKHPKVSHVKPPQSVQKLIDTVPGGTGGTGGLGALSGGGLGDLFGGLTGAAPAPAPAPAPKDDDDDCKKPGAGMVKRHGPCAE